MIRDTFSDFFGLNRKFNCISMLHDNAGWSLSEDARHLSRVAELAGLRLVPYRGLGKRQHVFHLDRYKAVRMLRWRIRPAARVSIPYYHGYPGEGNSEFDAFFFQLLRQKEKIFRIQITHETMREILLEGGVPAEKLVKIYIGIDTSVFTPKTSERSAEVRDALGIPRDSVVVGSFQKDGNGWDEGFSPKMIKGPDILCDTLALLRKKIPELFVLLSGPARGYIKQRLAAVNIPFAHRFFSSVDDLAACYHALDAYIVTSRQEGGPKAVLESMASGVPLITTPVGQAAELVRHGENGLLAEMENVEQLAAFAEKALSDAELQRRLITGGIRTAFENCYAAQVPLWKDFFAASES